jgi:hypothetical protein
MVLSYDSHPHIPDSIFRAIPHSRYSYNIAKILYILNKNIVHEAEVHLDAYLEEELYDNLTYCIQNSKAADFEIKRKVIPKHLEQEIKNNFDWYIRAACVSLIP